MIQSLCVLLSLPRLVPRQETPALLVVVAIPPLVLSVGLGVLLQSPICPKDSIDAFVRLVGVEVLVISRSLLGYCSFNKQF
jgi:hypothetical protein